MYNMENVIEKGGSPMLLLEKMAHRRITSANYITSVNGMVHPDRILAEHDFLYMLDGEWEIIEDGHIYEMHRDDLLILSAGRFSQILRLFTLPGKWRRRILSVPAP